MEKIVTDKVIIVEGKYDKIKLSAFIDGVIIPTNGFSVFNNTEKCQLIRKIAAEKGIIILTDSDGAGFVIRNKLRGLIGNTDNITNLYIPQIKGKETRKSKESKQGYLGVEGIDIKTIREIFEKAGVFNQSSEMDYKCYSKAELYELGYSGKDDSSAKRDIICKENGLPTGMSANAFLEAVNILKVKL